jgi:hypothetical protein
MEDSMSNNHDNPTSVDRPDKSGSKGNYNVGYGKPPVEHRFKHGNKANPKGRRKGSRNRKIVIREILSELVTVREGEDVKQITVLEAVFKKLLSKALQGDNKAALTVLGVAQREGILTPEQEHSIESLPEDDLAIIEDMRRRLAASAALPAADEPAGTAIA